MTTINPASVTIGNLKGIGPKAEVSFQKLGIKTVEDLLHYYPRDYDVYHPPQLISEAEEGRITAIYGEIVGNVSVINTRSISITSLHLRDESGIIKATWFRAPYLKNTLHTGMRIVLRGKVEIKKQQVCLEHPEIFKTVADYQEKVGTLQPKYALTKGITNNAITKAVIQADGEFGYLIEDVFTEEFREQYNLKHIKEAVKGIHFPVHKEEYYEARKRFVFEEFITFILALRNLKENLGEQVNEILLENQEAISLTDDFMGKLPYDLTHAQRKVWEEIKLDVANPSKVMSRLVQGDVGSGKTVVAILSILLAVASGYQGALMAPTEVLAKQHFISIKEMLDSFGYDFQVELLTGSMTAKQKREANQKIASGEAQIIIGTHALIQESVEYHNLGIVITDEQHRFGVKQRESFSRKGRQPHVLVMSATPIPRTLAIILYGDLDISVIDELPANRLPIKNCVVGTDYQPTAYKFMKNEIAKGRQCYVICPMVEESEHMEGANVIEYAKSLQEHMGPEIVVTHLHGKMKQSEKDTIMEAYYQKEIHILVSTTVIEVGINVPNASTMLIENSERFGLSGLHQLRGRVGRGKHQSYCIFMTSSKSKDTKERLDILAKSNDGFEIANQDLKLRGPGDLFGIRQSGLMNFKVADIYQDAKLLQLASEAVSSMDDQQKEKVVKKLSQKDIIL